MAKKVLWLMTMALLCLALFVIVSSRMDRRSDIIFGGVDGAYISSDSVSFTDPNSLEETVQPTEDIWPDIDIDLSQYRIVNADNLLSSAFEPDVAMDENGKFIPVYGTRYQSFDALAKPYLDQMIQDMNAAGFTVYVASSYRSYSYQNKLFNSKASQIAYGMGIEDYLDPKYQIAVAEAKTITAFPGSSEHQLGLAVDLMDRSYSRLDYSQMDQEFFAWLDEHCCEYGFIKRYPTHKLLITGWDEPWHYRYVGIEAATFIMENNLCYEEFYKHYVPDFEY